MSASNKVSKDKKGKGGINAIKKLIKKDIVNLDKEMVDYILETELYAKFIQRVEFWYSNPKTKLVYNQIFHAIRENVTYENYIAALIDLNAPCNELERHILARLLDPRNTGTISYLNLEIVLMKKSLYRDQRKSISQSSSKTSSKSEKVKKILDFTDAKPENVTLTCGLSEEGWLHLYIKMIKFERFPEHPGNFEIDVPDNINLDIVALRIQKMLDFATTNFTLYSTSNAAPEFKIDLNASFKDLGFIGGSKLFPLELTIYYDYKIGYIDDSLVMDLQF